ncbi:hypothetical protein [Alkalibacter saccharofermentans]|uniref:Polysaccharide deacetylase n=1 Tax=Alkalibacter saccharofermentans DSM 14828 TaxID=1120975 RepID=A0A1M4ZGH8_9FIRM|nr:hypothetical protein [Alkalibacter saccharofermentans]SHF17140.1 hypothetical protein SAMN02746064_02038 [Alkalibacter saccharofermentans DSM 14828]
MDRVKIKQGLKKIKREYLLKEINTGGFHTERKLLVFESDDWGSIRMPSGEIYEKLVSIEDPVDKDPFTKFDSLESEEDVKALLKALENFRDKNGRNPVVTANFAVANPDFRKIEEGKFESYYYEPFTKTYERYPSHRGSFIELNKAVRKGVIFPQFHCREHLNVPRWMRDLKSGKDEVRRAFDYNMISTASSFDKDNKFAYMDSFNLSNNEDASYMPSVLKEGLELFEDIFGFKSKSFIASCYVWDDDLEEELFKLGIEFIQGGRVQLVPRPEKQGSFYDERRHCIGQKNKRGQIYLVRNCDFEPAWNPDYDWVERCIEEIEHAFKYKKPATVSTHRLNYMGFIHENNREKNLGLLSNLFEKVLEKWPDIEFLTTVELGDLIKTNGNN